MNKRGFTLVELLAVITILAVIALITVPIISNSTKKSKTSSYIRSAELYISAVENTIMDKQINENFEMDDGTYSVSSDGSVCLDEGCSESLIINAKNKPKGGSLTIEGHTVVAVEGLLVSDHVVSTNTDGELEVVGE